MGLRERIIRFGIFTALVTGVLIFAEAKKKKKIKKMPSIVLNRGFIGEHPEIKPAMPQLFEQRNIDTRQNGYRAFPEYDPKNPDASKATPQPVYDDKKDHKNDEVKPK
jgi:hypothetical protein